MWDILFTFDKHHFYKMANRSTRTPAIIIKNTNLKTKIILMNIAKSEGRTLTQFSMYHFRKIIETYPESARNYTDDDGC